MREFYASGFGDPGSNGDAIGALVSYLPSRARVAIYDAPAAAPRIIEVSPAPILEYIEALASAVYHAAQDQGGSVPYTVIREVTENFIHAAFAEPVVSVLDSGSTLRFADQGPGFTDSERALEPGFTTASAEMKGYIRGVGSGLPLVRDFLSVAGGSMTVEDNLGSGAVITIRAGRAAGETPPAPTITADHRSPGSSTARGEGTPVGQNTIPGVSLEPDTRPMVTTFLTTRQKQVLALVMESGSAGPSLVSRELGVGISTAYRDLASLEEIGLIVADGGKRKLTPEGMSFLDGLIAGL